MIFGERLARNSRQAWSRVLTSRPRRAAPIKVRIAPWRSAAAAPMMSSVQTLRQWLGRLGKDSIYLMTGLPMGILTFTVAVTGWSLGPGHAHHADRLSDPAADDVRAARPLVRRARSSRAGDRRAAGRALQAGAHDRDLGPVQDGVLGRAELARPRLGAAAAADRHRRLHDRGRARSRVVLGLVFAPAWTWALWDSKDPVDLGLFHITNIWTALAATAIGIAIAPLALALIRGPASATGSLARALLAPRTEELEERVEVLQAHARRRRRRGGRRARRIERDLHDGAQARLVAIAMDLGLAQQKLDEDPEQARQLLAEARDGATAALVELRDLARGIRPRCSPSAGWRRPCVRSPHARRCRPR